MNTLSGQILPSPYSTMLDISKVEKIISVSKVQWMTHDWNLIHSYKMGSLESFRND